MQNTADVPLILFPGLGADASTFREQLQAFPSARVPAWIKPEPRESLADYGRRMAIEIGPHGRCIVGGASFGGAVALEVARHCAAKAVILMSSCRSGMQVPRRLRWLEFGCRVIPTAAIQLAKDALAPIIALGYGRMSAAQRADLIQIIRETSVEFLRWGARALMTWPGVGDLHCPVFHIHGDRDPIIPLKRVEPDVVVTGGGHLVNDTHAAQVNTYIARCMAAIR